ncbi:MAG TPA: glycogen synthase GlgA [Verrucomicrobiae bacterium]|nr:glycogen synthase GlgA [Verrucomicrobiae bacterium]
MAKKRSASTAPQTPKGVLPSQPAGGPSEKASDGDVAPPESAQKNAEVQGPTLTEKASAAFSSKPEPTAEVSSSKPPVEQFGARLVLPEAIEKLVEERKPSEVSNEKLAAPKPTAVEPPKVVTAETPATMETRKVAVKDEAAKSPPAPESWPKETAGPPSIAEKTVEPSAKKAEPKRVEKAVQAVAEPSPKKLETRSLSEEKIVGEVPMLETPKEEEVLPATPEAAAATPRPAIPPMYVMMISPELAPVAKVGGLGDVVYGLARELEIRGNSVEIILPKYNNMRYDHIWGLTKVYENLWVPWYGGAINTSVWFGFVHGRKCFFIDPHSNENFFNRGVYYGSNDDVFRFAFFCRAALEFMHKTNKHPEVIHCHDWQTALVPVLLYEMYQHLGMRHSRVCFTVHNFRHQGVAGGQILQATGLHRPEHFFHYDRMRDNNNRGALNLMKAGIVYSNFTTTVSPRHAWEAKDAGQGHGLEPTLHTHHYKFGGVLNGLDYEQFNPENDPHIPAHFNVETIEKKYENKRALRHRFWLADNAKPIIAFIGRLDQQKGLELVRHAIFYALQNRAQFVLLGNSPERGINDHFLGLKHHLNNSPDCHLEIGYHEELAHLIYSGADMMVVPSRYEPCGLTQLISLRYGTVPVVRSVGGLADTVFDKDYSTRPLNERNGYVFEHGDNPGLESALHRAIGCYYEFPEHWRQLMINGMKCDNSWNHPGQHYVNIYDFIRDK